MQAVMASFVDLLEATVTTCATEWRDSSCGVGDYHIGGTASVRKCTCGHCLAVHPASTRAPGLNEHRSTTSSPRPPDAVWDFGMFWPDVCSRRRSAGSVAHAA